MEVPPHHRRISALPCAVIDAADAALQLAAPILTHHVLLRSAASDEQIAETITQFLASHATKTEATEQLD